MKTLVRASTLVALVLALLTAGTSPAGATPNENFVDALYQDFLFRAPTSDELTWWTSYIAGGGTKGAVAAAVIDGDEFKWNWVLAVQNLYNGELSATFTEAQFANLHTDDNFLAVETNTLGTAKYYANAGSTNVGFVEALYLDVLSRAADTTGRDFWVGRLDNGLSTRSQVAASLIRTSEAATRRVAGRSGMAVCDSVVLSDETALTSGGYCIILDRLADSTGQTFWVGQLSGTAQLPTLWSSLAGSVEYFNNAQ